jgi:glycosyltransferase involved in cell wall biosynthesis
MNDAALREKMGKAGRKRVVANFDYRIVAKKFVEIIERRIL